MGPLQQLELKLDELLDKKAPFKIPPDGRRALAHPLWIVALVVGIIRLWSAIQLWQWGHRADEFLNSLSYYTGGAYVHHLGTMYYLSLIAMGAVGVLLLMAAPSLKAMRKTGWDLLFYSSLIQIVTAVLQLFATGGGLADFLGGIIAAAIGLYLLFQVRECFIMSHPADHTAATHPHKAAGGDTPAKDTSDAAHHDAPTDDKEV